MNTSLSSSVLALARAGATTLLEALPDSIRPQEELALCVVDGARLEDAAQNRMLSEVAEDCRKSGTVPIFVLTKADCLSSVRASVSRLLTRLRELGFDSPEIYPVCAQAACLFLLPTRGREMSEAEQDALAEAYDRFGPAENSLSGYAVTDGLSCSVGRREVSPEQLRLALENTGIPALAARLRENRARPAHRPAPAQSAPVRPAPVQPAPSQPEPTAEAQAQPPEAPEPQAPAVPAIDLEAWCGRIETASAEELSALEEGLHSLSMDETTAAELRAAANRRRWKLQEEAVEAMIADHEQLDCAGLLDLAQKVRDSDFPPKLQENALQTLQSRFSTLELTELRELTLDSDSLDIPALHERIDQINAGPYTAQTRAPYVDLLNHRIDELHRQAMDELCRDVETADAGKLGELRAALDERDCAEILKTEYYQMLDDRKDALDHAALTELTKDADLLPLSELDALAEKLESEDWNPKFIREFRHRVALSREAAQYHAVREQAESLDTIGRKEVLALREQLAGEQLPARMTREVEDRIEERLYRLDILRLLTAENDFDSLGFDQIDALRLRLTAEDCGERARTEYLKKLDQREHSLIYENTASHAALVQQVAAQMKLKLVDFDISTTAKDYDGKLKRFWGGSGMEEPRDIPVFLHANASVLAFSGQRFWYKTGRDLAFLPLAEIETFQILKQVLSANLQIVRKDNTYLLTDAKLFRSNAAQVVGFLNECLRRWNELSLPDGSPSSTRTPSFSAEVYSAPLLAKPLSEQTVLEILRAQCAKGKIRDGSIQQNDDEAWQSKTRKLLQSFGLPERTKLVWFDTSGVLGSIKEGIAAGPNGLYILENKQPVRTVLMEDIFSLTKSGKRACLTTIRGQTYTLELAPAMIAPLAEYIKGIQLIGKLRSLGEA